MSSIFSAASRILPPPQNLSQSRHRIYWLSAGVYSISLLLHISFIFLFAYPVDCVPLAVLNVFSTALFVLIILINKHGKLEFAFILFLIETNVHAFACTVLLGNAGFSFWLLPVTAMVFFSPIQKSWVRLSLASVIALHFIVLESIVFFGSPISTKPDFVLQWMLFFNILGAYLVFNLMSFYYSQLIERTESELRTSQERLVLALDGAREGMWDWHIVTDELHYSKSWFRLLGYDPSEFELTIESWFGMLHPNDINHFRQFMNDFKEGKKPFGEKEVRLKEHSGGYRWVLIHGHAMSYDKMGHPIRAAGTFLDIQERKELENKIEQLRNEYESFMRHELKNLLTPVIGFSELLKMDTSNLTEKQAEYLNKVYVSAEQAVSLIDDLKQLQDIEHGEYSLNAESIDLTDVLNKTLDTLQVLAEKLDVNLIFHNEIEGNAIIQGDKSLLPGVFINLIKNAVEHVAPLDSPDEKKVFVTLNKNNNQYSITIQNRGKEIPEEKIATFFEKFNSDREAKSEGTGLGTTYAYLVTTAHNGKIHVASDAQQGTQVTVSLPVN